MDNENYFTTNSTFGTADEFQIGAAVTAYDGNKSSIEDVTIGTLEFYIKEFGTEANPGLNFRKVENKPCEFNNVDGTNLDSSFYPTLPNSENDILTYGPKMKCINEEGFDLFGNYDTAAAKNLLVTFDKCDPEKRNDCKSEQEITDWLSSKYIIILENSKSFVM